jgi:hypothetical protein
VNPGLSEDKQYDGETIKRADRVVRATTGVEVADSELLDSDGNALSGVSNQSLEEIQTAQDAISKGGTWVLDDA